MFALISTLSDVCSNVGLNDVSTNVDLNDVWPNVDLYDVWPNTLPMFALTHLCWVSTIAHNQMEKAECKIILVKILTLQVPCSEQLRLKIFLKSSCLRFKWERKLFSNIFYKLFELIYTLTYLVLFQKGLIKISTHWNFWEKNTCVWLWNSNIYVNF